MTLSIRTSSAIGQAQRQLNETGNQLSKTLERLSSGVRVESGAEAAVVSVLKAQSVTHSRAVLNISDGVSIFAVATSALDALRAITTRQLELANQAMNGAYSTVQRSALQAEADALRAEYNRIAASARFNDRDVFDAADPTLDIQAGISGDGQIRFEIGSELANAVGNGTFAAGVSFSENGDANTEVNLIDLNSDGNLDQVIVGRTGTGIMRVRFGNGDGSFTLGATYVTEGGATFGSIGMDSGDLDGDGDLDIITVGQNGSNQAAATIWLNDGMGGLSSAGSLVFAGIVGRDVEIADFNADGVLDAVVAGSGGGTLLLGNGDGTFEWGGAFATEPNGSTGVVSGDFDGDGNLDVATSGNKGGPTQGVVTIRRLDGSGGTLGVSQFNLMGLSALDLVAGDFNEDGFDDVAVATIAGVVLVFGDNAGISGPEVELLDGQARSITIEDVNSDGHDDLVVGGNGHIRILQGDGTGSFTPAYSIAAETGITVHIAFGDITSDGVADMVSVGVDSGGTIPYGNVFIQNATTSFTSVALNLSSVESARTGRLALDTQMSRIDREYSQIASAQSRLVFALENAQVARENLAAAVDTISSVDVAEETARLVSLTIRRDAATAVLAQANLRQRDLLSLLESGSP